jgi:hypothetical protein
MVGVPSVKPPAYILPSSHIINKKYISHFFFEQTKMEYINNQKNKQPPQHKVYREALQKFTGESRKVT